MQAKTTCMVLLCLITCLVQGQEQSQIIGAPKGSVKIQGRLYVDSTLQIPKKDTSDSKPLRDGAIVKHFDNKYYLWDSTGNKYDPISIRNSIGLTTTGTGAASYDTLTGVLNIPIGISLSAYNVWIGKQSFADTIYTRRIMPITGNDEIANNTTPYNAIYVNYLNAKTGFNATNANASYVFPFENTSGSGYSFKVGSGATTLEIRKDTTTMKGKIFADNLKNNVAGDSLLTTDNTGKMKLKYIAPGGDMTLSTAQTVTGSKTFSGLQSFSGYAFFERSNSDYVLNIRRSGSEGSNPWVIGQGIKGSVFGGSAQTGDLLLKTYSNNGSTFGDAVRISNLGKMTIQSVQPVAGGWGGLPAQLELKDAGSSIILASPNGTRYKLTVSDAGAIVATPL